MALLDFLTGGDKPTRRTAGSAETALTSAVDSIDAQRGGLTNVVNLFGDTLNAGRKGARSDVIGAASADIAQRFAGDKTTKQGDMLENTIRRARGLSRLVAGRGNEFDSQLLRDRVAFTKGAAARRGAGLRGLATAANIQEQVAGATDAANKAKDAARDNLFGTAVGLGAGFATNSNLFKRTPGAPDITQAIDAPVTTLSSGLA